MDRYSDRKSVQESEQLVRTCEVCFGCNVPHMYISTTTPPVVWGPPVVWRHTRVNHSSCSVGVIPGINRSSCGVGVIPGINHSSCGVGVIPGTCINRSSCDVGVIPGINRSSDPVMWGLYQVSTTYEMKPPYEGLLLKLNLVVMCTLVLS